MTESWCPHNQVVSYLRGTGLSRRIESFSMPEKNPLRALYETEQDIMRFE